jgi:outer membrane receptor for ferrienterochelin and colicin
MHVKILYSFILILLLFFNALAGQTGKIAGRVIDDSSGEMLPGVNIFLEGTTLGAATDLEGDFIILNIPPGNYIAKAMMVGYQDVRITNVDVSIDRTTRLEIKLTPEIIEGEVIVVEAQRPLIQKDLTATEASVSSQEIRSIPVESLQDVLQLQAGVTVDSRGEIHIRGGRSSEIEYLVDGISVSDPFSGRMAVKVNHETIQELKIISGTFNAEYGRVMSGIVEVITKEPENKFNVDASFYLGDYLSKDSDVFYNVDELNPLHIYNAQLYLTGPLSIITPKLSYYVSLRREYDEGWLYGQRRFLPSDSSKFVAENAYIEENGDKQPVAMNYSSRYFGNFKLIFKFSPSIKISYNFLSNYNDFSNYDHLYKYNPDGNIANKEFGYTHRLDFNQALSKSTFYTVKISRYAYDLKSYLYEDLNDPRYQNPELLRNREDAFSFLTGGTNMIHFKRNTEVTLGKFDITSQIDKIHQIKFGLEFKSNNIYVNNDEAYYKGEKSTIFSAEAFFNRGEYTHRPIEFSAYIQDKVELENMTLNLGFRYDYFDSKGEVPTDLRDPQNLNAERGSDAGYKDAQAQHQLSPRFGIAFPISASGVIHASYGHFFQIPPFEYLYINPRFAVAPGGLYTLIGNTELKPQSTIIYELGLQQEFISQLGVSITGFFKDVRNLLGTNIYETYVLGDRYARYENRDYGNIRGITLSLNKRPTPSDYISLSFDYTFQVAEGNASDPNHVFNNNQADPPKQSNIQVVPLDWDQTHTINLSVSYDNPALFSFGLIGQFRSGLPYTPAIQNLETTFENSGRKPYNYSVDLRISKNLLIQNMQFSLFLKVYNVFDMQNELSVYSDTGRAGYSLVSRYLGERRSHVNSLEEWLTRPDYYSHPRKILVGLSINL